MSGRYHPCSTVSKLLLWSYVLATYWTTATGFAIVRSTKSTSHDVTDVRFTRGVACPGRMDRGPSVSLSQTPSSDDHKNEHHTTMDVEDLEAEEIKVADEHTLFHRIGGSPAFVAAVDEFYNRLIHDDDLHHYFEGVDLVWLKHHQVLFMEIAFTEIPQDLDLKAHMVKSHKRLWPMGLSANDFDLVAGHLVGALKHLSVPDDLIDEAVSVVGPLRAYFEYGHDEQEQSDT